MITLALVGAVALAVTGAACLAATAVLQHDAVRRYGLATAWRSPRWLAGAVTAAAGMAAHAGALSLAPLAVVQPLGVLAVPLGVLLERRHAARTGTDRAQSLRPGVLVALTCTLGGIALFTAATTTAAAATDPGPAPDVTRLLSVVGVVAAVAVVLGVLSNRCSGAARCVLRAVPAAVAIGLAAAVLRTGLRVLGEGGGADTLVVLAVVLPVLALVGGLGVQVAYRSGPPSLVVACLTVVDPLVAVCVGSAALDERVADGAAGVLLAVAGALLAAAGVLVLARHHSDTAHATRPAPPDAAVPALTTSTPMPSEAHADPIRRPDPRSNP